MVAHPDLQEHYLLAVQDHQAGRLREAEAGYRRILAADPRHADSLNLLGVVAAQCGHPEAAIELIGKAIRLNESVANYHVNLGRAEQIRGRPEKATECYRRALVLEPNNADAHNNLGCILQDRHRYDAAAEHFERSLTVRPDYAEALLNLSEARRNQGRLEEAVACGLQAVGLQPASPAAHNNLGLALYELGRVDEAMSRFDQALALRPDFAEALINLGRAHLDQARLSEAVACSELAITIRPNSPEAYNNLGAAFEHLGQVETSLSYFHKALALRPNYIDALNNLGLALRHVGQPEAALEQFERTLSLSPDHAEAQLNQAMVRLLTGALRPGWLQYEWRWRSKQQMADRREFGVPCWDGSSGAGRTILVWAEQGLGDSIQFCRYVPLLAERDWNVVLEVPPPLVRLFRNLSGVGEVLAQGPAAERAIDCHCPMMSLPRHFDTVIETIPAQLPYLSPRADDVAYWGRRLGEVGLAADCHRVGLVWAGNPRRHSPLHALTDSRR